MATNLDFVGLETQVNVSPHQNNSQDDPDVAATTLGRFFVAYEDFDLNAEIVGQFINADGTLDAATVDFTEADAQRNPSVAQRLGGGVAVVYEDFNHSAVDPDIYLRIVSSAGVVGPEIEVAGNTVDAANALFDPDIAMLADGREVVVYTNQGVNADLHLRVLNAAGTAFEAGFVDVNSGAGDQQDAAIAASGSNAAIVYEDNSAGGTGGSDIRLQIFNGTTAGPAQLVADHAKNLFDADVAALSDGRFVVVYEEDNGTNDDLFGRIYNPTTNTFSSEFTINKSGDTQGDVRVAATSDGGFVATWEDGSGNPAFPGDNDGTQAVHAQRFDRNGVAVGDEFLVNNEAPFTNDQDNPAVALNSSGQVYFAFEDSEARTGTGADTGPDGIRGHAAALSNNPVNGTAGNDLITTYDLNEIVNGGAGIDVINARGGADLVNGGLGSDLLTLGPGADILLFNTAIKPAANIDVVTDFNPLEDIIQLDDAIFKKIGLGALKNKFFHIGKEAHDANDHIIYNKNSGALIYDKNGDDPGKAFQFATLSPGLDITKGDFLIV